MNIGVNARLLLPGKLEGIGWFAHETLSRITHAHPEHTFHFFFDRPFDERFLYSPNVVPHVLKPQARHPLLWYLFFERSISRTLKKVKADFFFSPENYLCLRTRVPSVGVAHDIAYEHFPEHVGRLTGAYYRHYFPRYARRAVRLATVSDFSKQDISSRYHIPPEKIDVVYNGVNRQYRPLTQEEITATRNLYSKGAPYFVFIGGLYPRKNLARLLMAFDTFRSKYQHPFKLLIIGNLPKSNEALPDIHAGLRHKEDVVFLGRIKDTEETNLLLGSALAMTYVSLFEGFGIPILEAMQVEIPVLASNTSSMPEVGGNAAIYCNPSDMHSIEEGMLKLVTQPTLREALITEGRRQRMLFSWDKTAGLLWQCIEKGMAVSLSR